MFRRTPSLKAALPRHLTAVWLLTLLTTTPFLGTSAQADGISHTVTVITNKWSPDPAFLGDPNPITSPATASDSSAPQPQAEHTITPHWVWTTQTVYRSDNGTPGTFSVYTGNYGIAWKPNDATVPDVTFNGIFNDAGYYIVKVYVTVHYHDDTADKDVQTSDGYGYLGGSESDVAAAPPSSTGNNSTDHAASTMQPMDETGRTGVAVRRKGKIVIVLDKSTVGIGKNVTGKATAVDENGNTLSDVWVTVSNSEDKTTQSEFGQRKISFGPTIVGTIKFTATSTDLPANSPAATASANIVKPDGETLTKDTTNFPPDGWSGAFFNVHSVLTPLSVDFSGDTVQETDPDPNPDHDGCWYAKSTWPKMEALPGPKKEVVILAGNSFARDDRMGLGDDYITHYRTDPNAVLPCSVTLHQDMSVVAYGIAYFYTSHVFVYTLDKTTLAVTKDNVPGTRSYP